MLPRVTEKRGQKNYENHNTRKYSVRNSRNGCISKIGTMEISIDVLMARGDVPPIDNNYRQLMATTGRRFNLSWVWALHLAIRFKVVIPESICIQITKADSGSCIYRFMHTWIHVMITIKKEAISLRMGDLGRVVGRAHGAERGWIDSNQNCKKIKNKTHDMLIHMVSRCVKWNE